MLSTFHKIFDNVNIYATVTMCEMEDIRMLCGRAERISCKLAYGMHLALLLFWAFIQ